MWARIDDTMARQIRRLRPIPRAALDSTTAALADQIERDFGAFVPPFALHAAVPSLLAASWTMVREALVTVHVDRLRKEAVATAVSRANACTYCVDAHATALHALGAGDAADALTAAGGAGDAPSDPRLASLVAWAAATRTADDPRLRTPPFTPAEAPELVAIALAFHYINRLVALFLAPSPLPFESPRLKRFARRALRPVLRGPLARRLAAGASLDFLPAAALPADLAWSTSHPTLADALARAAAGFESAGTAHLPSAVRTLVASRIETWRGENPGLGRHWCEEAVATLPADERPRARLALLAAFAPYQVDDDVIADVRRGGADDDTLVALAAWASFTAARRIASWVAG
jgi:AhpD family alkylhydroperoxidase